MLHFAPTRCRQCAIKCHGAVVDAIYSNRLWASGDLRVCLNLGGSTAVSWVMCHVSRKAPAHDAATGCIARKLHRWAYAGLARREESTTRPRSLRHVLLWSCPRRLAAVGHVIYSLFRVWPPTELASDRSTAINISPQHPYPHPWRQTIRTASCLLSRRNVNEIYMAHSCYRQAIFVFAMHVTDVCATHCLVWFILRPCHHDNGFTDARSHADLSAHRRTEPGSQHPVFPGGHPSKY